MPRCAFDPKRWNKPDVPVAAVVTSRRQPREKRKVEEDPNQDALVESDASKVCSKKPSHRVKWLQEALIQAAQRRIKVDIIYNIIVDSMFAQDTEGSHGEKMKQTLLANLHVFSSKQQKYLQSPALKLGGGEKKQEEASSRRKSRRARDDSREREDEDFNDSPKDMQGDYRSRSRDRQDGRGRRGVFGGRVKAEGDRGSQSTGYKGEDRARRRDYDDAAGEDGGRHSRRSGRDEFEAEDGGRHSRRSNRDEFEAEDGARQSRRSGRDDGGGGDWEDSGRQKYDDGRRRRSRRDEAYVNDDDRRRGVMEADL